MSKSANDRQVGGNHYRKVEGEQHWDRAWRLKYDPFQYIITKWVERWRDKGGIEDLEKARHALDKYIEIVKADYKDPTPARVHHELAEGGATREYTNQDR